MFLEKEPFENDKFPAISDTFKYYKEDEEGVQSMCSIVEEYAKEGIKEVAKKLIDSDLNLSDEKISEMTSLSIEEVAKLRG